MLTIANKIVLVNNFYGRQWNSLNDVAVNPRNGDVYFTDTLYGYLQDFRPSPQLPNQVYRFNPSTGAVTVVADGFELPNGAFSLLRAHVDCLFSCVSPELWNSLN